jgi:hypothetical protein
LTFDRPIDISGFSGPGIGAKDGIINTSQYVGLSATLTGPSTVEVILDPVAPYFEADTIRGRHQNYWGSHSSWSTFENRSPRLHHRRKSQSHIVTVIGLLCRVIDNAEFKERFHRKPKESLFFHFSTRHYSGRIWATSSSFNKSASAQTWASIFTSEPGQ